MTRSRQTSKAGTAAYHWTCGCGETGTGEAAAQRHAKVCDRMGWPKTQRTKTQEGR